VTARWARAWCNSGRSRTLSRTPWIWCQRTRCLKTNWKQGLEGQDDAGRIVALVHEDTAALRRMAVFDVIVNIADRKGDHNLALKDGHRYGVDHGLTFHNEHKLRTVLWGCVGEELTEEDIQGFSLMSTTLTADLRSALAELLTAVEIDTLPEQCDRVRVAARHPAPIGRPSADPWPLF